MLSLLGRHCLLARFEYLLWVFVHLSSLYTWSNLILGSRGTISALVCSLPAGFFFLDKCNTMRNYYCRVYLPFLYSVELPEFTCEVSVLGISPALWVSDSATTFGSSGVHFGFLLSPLSLKTAFVWLNMLNLT